MSRDRPVLLSVVQFAEALETEDRSVPSLLPEVADRGFDGIELRRELWPNYQDEIEEVTDLADEHDLLITYATFSELLGQDRGEGQEMLIHDIDVAADLGAPFLRVFLGHTVPEDHHRWAAAREAIAHADERGVDLALENRGSMPGATLAEIEDGLEALAAPALRINLDIGNYYANDEDVLEAIESIGDRVVGTHLVDETAPGGALGPGEMPLEAIFDALDALDQRVVYCFEFRGGDDPEEAIRRSREFLRSRGQ